MSLADVVTAAERQKKTTADLTEAAYKRAGKAWNRVNPGSIVSSWANLSTAIVAAIMIAQTKAIEANNAFLDTAFGEQNLEGSIGHVNTSGIVGTMPATAATLDAALAGVAFHSLDRISRGDSTRQAMEAGMLELAHLTQYAVADASRAAAQIRVGTATQTVGYTRVVSTGCCARCAVLAGRFYRWNEGFLRHPMCKCLHLPTTSMVAAQTATDPYEQFNALSKAEQDRIYTKSGAEAIRNGADMNQVVNARRGMSTSGRFTSEGTSRRGFYRTSTEAGQKGYRRLSVDEIMRRSNGNKDRFQSMLTEYGYLTEWGQVGEGAIIGQREGFGQFGRGGRRVGAREAVKNARRTGVRDPRSRYTMTAAERRAFDAQNRL